MWAFSFYILEHKCACKKVLLSFISFFSACPRFFINDISSHSPSSPNTHSCWLTQENLRYLVSTSHLFPRLTIGLLAGESTYLWLLRLDWWWRGRSGLNPVTINLWPLKTSHRLITESIVCANRWNDHHRHPVPATPRMHTHPARHPPPHKKLFLVHTRWCFTKEKSYVYHLELINLTYCRVSHRGACAWSVHGFYIKEIERQFFFFFFFFKSRLSPGISLSLGCIYVNRDDLLDSE